mgnify:CR=1 FL=1
MGMGDGKPAVYHLSRDDAEHFVFDEPFVVVSVTDPGATPLTFVPCEKRRAILRLAFHDLDFAPEDVDVSSWVLYTKEHAKTIINFVLDWRYAVRLIVFSCEAGLSRSAALAAAVAYGLLADALPPRKGVPNRSVFLETLVTWAALQEGGMAHGRWHDPRMLEDHQ